MDTSFEFEELERGWFATALLISLVFMVGILTLIFWERKHEQE